jgi:hypothetical protein
MMEQSMQKRLELELELEQEQEPCAAMHAIRVLSANPQDLKLTGQPSRFCGTS